MMGWADELAAAQAAPQPAARPQPAAAPAAPASWTDELLRQGGLTLRHGITGLTAIPALVGNGLNGAINMGIDGVNALAGTKIGHLDMPTRIIQQWETQAGLPEPRNRTERLVGDVASSMAGAAPTVLGSRLMTQAASPIVQNMGRIFGTAPGNQVVASGAAGGTAGTAREAGLGEGWQLAAGLVGGLGGALASGSAASGLRWLGSKTAPGLTEAVAPGAIPTARPQAAAQAVESAAAGGAMSPEAQAAAQGRVENMLLSNPGADPYAAARAADFRQLGMEPTLGQVARDPIQFALEQNMRSQSPKLTARFNTQMRQLGELLGNMVGTPAEKYPAGRKLADALTSIDERLRTAVSDEYTAQRASTGAEMEVPLQGLAQDYARILKDFPDAAIGGVRNRMDELGLLSGTQRKVFNFNDAEDLLKLINAHDGPTVAPATGEALGQLRRAVKTAVTSADDEGGPYAFARALAKQRFDLHDQVPLLDRVVTNRVAPDDIVGRYLTGGKTEDVQGLADLLRQYAPEAMPEVRAQLGENLRKSAFGFNPNGDKAITPARYAEALDKLGTDKLGAVFGPDEIDTLQAIRRVGSHIAVEPAAAAVNRSNTGATLLDLAGHIPVAGKAVRFMVDRAAIAKALEANLADTQNPFITSAGATPVAPLFVNTTRSASNPK